MRSALEWAQVRALAVDGVSEREIARRLGINRRTVARLARSEEPPRYRRALTASKVDPFEMKRRLWELRPRAVRPAQRTGYRPGQVLQLDWAEMPNRPVVGRPRAAGVRAGCVAAVLGCADRVLFAGDDAEAFLEGHVRALEWLGGVPRECVYDNLRSVVARREGDEVIWNRRFLHLRGHYGFRATACTPATPREKGSVEAAVRYLKSGFWPARRFADLRELDGQYADWRDRVCNVRTHASGRFPVGERLAEERQALRPLPPLRFEWSGQRTTRVPIDGYLRHGGCFYRAPERLVHERVELRFDRDQVCILHRGVEVARYPRGYEQGLWLPPPIMRPEPPAVAPPPIVLPPPLAVPPPELADYAELCA